jgi:tetratricopeptide (TPR) repeat protein
LRKFRSLLVAAALTLPAPLTAGPPPVDLLKLTEQARPAVLLLEAYDASGRAVGRGIGFVVSPRGTVVTLFHVVDGAERIAAAGQDNREFTVKGVLAKDPKSNLAILQIEGNEFPALVLGSSKGLEPGTPVAVGGNPLDPHGALSAGTVAAIGKFLELDRALKITATVSQGSNGSPVLDRNGEVIGVTTVVRKKGKTLYFAVPVEHARALVAGILAPGDVTPSEKGVGALDTYREALTQEPKNAEAWYAMGSRYQGLDRADDALSALQKAVDLKPDYAEAWKALGKLYAELGRMSEAVTANREVVNLLPNDAELWLTLGRNYSAANRQKDAIAAYTRSIKLKRDRVDAWTALGSEYSRSLLSKHAIAAYRQATKLSSDSPALWTEIGHEYRKTGRTAQAVESFQKVVELKKDDAHGWLDLALAYEQSDDTAEAIQAYEHALKLDQGFAEAWYAIGRLYMSAGQKANAVNALRQLQKVDPDLARELAPLIK